MKWRKREIEDGYGREDEKLLCVFPGFSVSSIDEEEEEIRGEGERSHVRGMLGIKWKRRQAGLRKEGKDGMKNPAGPTHVKKKEGEKISLGEGR